jgi:hypothetical protein
LTQREPPIREDIADYVQADADEPTPPISPTAVDDEPIQQFHDWTDSDPQRISPR